MRGRRRARRSLNPLDGATDLAFLVMFLLMVMLATRSEERTAAPTSTLPLPNYLLPAPPGPRPKKTPLIASLRHPTKTESNVMVELRSGGRQPSLHLDGPLTEDAARRAQEDATVFFEPVRALILEMLTRGAWDGEQVLLEIERTVPFYFVDQLSVAVTEAARGWGEQELEIGYLVDVSEAP